MPAGAWTVCLQFRKGNALGPLLQLDPYFRTKASTVATEEECQDRKPRNPDEMIEEWPF